MYIWGKVRKKNQRGRKLGFPTANINLRKKIPEGIYLSQTKVAGQIYASLTFVGRAKTFDERKVRAEVYILDFKQNIYGKWISVSLFKKLRNNRKFNSADKLVAQMKQDETLARRFFGLLTDEQKFGKLELV